MQITIISVGKTLSPELKHVADQYSLRLRSEAKIEHLLLQPVASSSANQQRKKESDMIMSRLKSSDVVVLLDERGTLLDNEALYKKIDSLSAMQGRLVFIVGGAFGVTEDLRGRAAFVWSLSPLVFPHQLVYVLLLEQLYRTFRVKQGHPYHHV